MKHLMSYQSLNTKLEWPSKLGMGILDFLVEGFQPNYEALKGLPVRNFVIPSHLPVNFEELGRILGQLRAVHDQHPDLLGLGEAPVTQVGAAQVEMLPVTIINPQLGEFQHRQADQQDVYQTRI